MNGSSVQHTSVRNEALATCPGYSRSAGEHICARSSPITGEVITHVRITRPEEANPVIGRAAQAFTVWRKVPPPRRGEFVRILAEELRAAKDDLGRLVTLETGKIMSEGLGGVQEMIDICDFAAGLSRLCQRPLHALEGTPIDEQTDERSCLAGIADFYRRVNLEEPRHQAVIDIGMHEEPLRRTALASRAHGCEGDGPEGQIEIGGGRDDRSIVATELKDRAGESGGKAGADGAAHGGRARSRDDGHAGEIDATAHHLALLDEIVGHLGIVRDQIRWRAGIDLLHQRRTCLEADDHPVPGGALESGRDVTHPPTPRAHAG
jgi:hypothetical protein